MDTDIWRNDESRQKIVNKIMDTLQRHMPQTGPDGMNELKKIALRFEDKIYTHATSQIDYLRRISLKMLSLESKASQPSFSGSSSSNNQRPLDAAQQSTLQQTYRSALHHHQQSIIRQQQSQQSVIQQQQQVSMFRQSVLSPQQQHQQRLGQQNNVSNMQQQQNQLQQLLQSKHQQTQQTSPSSLFQSQSQQLQQLSQQQQLFSELQSQSQPLQQQQPLLHQSNPTQQELQRRLQTTGGLLQQLQQSSIEQQNQLLQQRGLSEASSTSMESSDQPGQSTVADCQEKVYQRLQNLKDMYYPEIKEILTKLQLKCQQPIAPNKLEKLQHYINTLQRMIKYFQVQKSRIPPGFKEDKIDAFEKQIQAILNSFKQRKSAPQQLPNQIVSQVQSMQLREEQS